MATAEHDTGLKASNYSDDLVLVTATKCPNCAMAKRFLDAKGYSYKTVNGSENEEFAEKYAIKQAPTLLVFDDDGQLVGKYTNLSNIKGYIDQE